MILASANLTKVNHVPFSHSRRESRNPSVERTTPNEEASYRMRLPRSRSRRVSAPSCSVEVTARLSLGRRRDSDGKNAKVVILGCSTTTDSTESTTTDMLLAKKLKDAETGGRRSEILETRSDIVHSNVNARDEEDQFRIVPIIDCRGAATEDVLAKLFKDGKSNETHPDLFHSSVANDSIVEKHKNESDQKVKDNAAREAHLGVFHAIDIKEKGKAEHAKEEEEGEKVIERLVRGKSESADVRPAEHTGAIPGAAPAPNAAAARDAKEVTETLAKAEEDEEEERDESPQNVSVTSDACARQVKYGKAPLDKKEEHENETENVAKVASGINGEALESTTDAVDGVTNGNAEKHPRISLKDNVESITAKNDDKKEDIVAVNGSSTAGALSGLAAALENLQMQQVRIVTYKKCSNFI